MYLSPAPLDFYRPLLNGSTVSAFELPPSGSSLAGRWSDGALLRFAASLPRELRDVARYVDLFRSIRPSIVHAWLDEVNVKAGLAAVIVGVPRIVLSGRSVAPTNFRLFQPYMAESYRLLLGEPSVTLLNNSAVGAGDYANWLKWPPAAIQVVRNGVDLSTAQQIGIDGARRRLRELLGLRSDSQIVGTVIRLSEEKRPLLWIESAARLAALRPACHFVIVGEGNLSNSAKELAEKLGIASQCHFVGRRDDPLEWMAGFDLFLLTSRKEGLPNVLIEAQGLGVPVVTTDAGGAIEALLPGATGWIVEGADPGDIAQAVGRALDEPNWRTAVRDTGPQFVASRFGVDRMITETLEVYRQQAVSQ